MNSALMFIAGSVFGSIFTITVFIIIFVLTEDR